MSEFTDKVAALEAVLANSTVFDRFLMDKEFKQLSGLTLTGLDPKFRKKLERVLSGFDYLGKMYPQIVDETGALWTDGWTLTFHARGRLTAGTSLPFQTAF